jgi:FkbM family methyltransferase
MSWFIRIYALVVYFIFIFLLRSVYRKQPTTVPFSAQRHTKMAKLYFYADGVFNLVTRIVGRKNKYNYTMTVNYEGSKLLIRPFSNLLEIIMVSPAFEPYVKAILYKGLKSNDVVIDIGANIGVYVIPLAKKVGQVIAFEPHPKSFEMLEKSVELNQLHNVVVINKSVSDSKNHEVLLDISDGPTYSKVIPTDFLGKVTTYTKTESIDLDTALAGKDRVDWLLIDVEGHEINVLKGARNILQRYSPKIIAEISVNKFDKVSEILSNHGYSITTLYGHTLNNDNNVSYCYAVRA